MVRARVFIASFALILAGCYHATIETGRTPSTVTFEQRWANSWILGLVPPDVMNTSSRCPSGVARVETQLSFLNQLVGALTLGIYTPMDVRVTCAQGSAAAPAIDDATLYAAVQLSLALGKPVLVGSR
ncbi:MAG: Bor family protein [Gemmatimonadaceae bacterium]